MTLKKLGLGIFIVLFVIPIIVVAHGDEELPEPDFVPRILQPGNHAIVPTTFSIDFIPHEDEAIYLYLLVDADVVNLGAPIPDDENHILLEPDATEYELSLPEGEHRLIIQTGTSGGISRGVSESSAEVFINVVEGAADRSVHIVSPENGSVVPGTFGVVIAATGMVLDTGDTTAEAHPHLYVSKLDDQLEGEEADYTETCILDDTHHDDDHESTGIDDHSDDGHDHEDGEHGDSDHHETNDDNHGDNDHEHGGETSTSDESFVVDRFDTPTCAMLNLDPGVYTLRLELADQIHMTRTGEAFVDEINIVVSDG